MYIHHLSAAGVGVGVGIEMFVAILLGCRDVVITSAEQLQICIFGSNMT